MQTTNRQTTPICGRKEKELIGKSQEQNENEFQNHKKISSPNLRDNQSKSITPFAERNVDKSNHNQNQKDSRTLKFEEYLKAPYIVMGKSPFLFIHSPFLTTLFIYQINLQN